ncbi:hypothetical protein MLD38_009360 [Melastoma candidum]|uniref:Uncharacterized protein n=1 Tax=Melastoma candidum TaxID=119954 RepID=A0ACB9RWZ2_9MYRT|nr:hypothetical protein MLD38_009360 [Melastoma candidum]
MMCHHERARDLSGSDDDKQWENKKTGKRTSIVKEPSRVTSSIEAGSPPIRMSLPAFLMLGKKQRHTSAGNRSKTPVSSPRSSLDRTDGRWPSAREDEWKKRSKSRDKQD